MNAQSIIEAPQDSNTEAQVVSIRESVEIAMRNYFSQLEGEQVTNVYQMVLQEMEAPLLEAVMNHVRDNQTQASQVLGLNRGTLRKKLKQYGML